MADQMSIEINDLSKRYGYSYALRNVTLTASHGEVLGLLGPNGSGKSTLLKVLATLTSPTSGNVQVYGLSRKEHGREIRRMIGYLAHESLLYRDFTGEENIKFYSQFYQFTTREQFQERLDDTLKLLKISRRRYEPVKNLSSGLRKRFDFVRAIIHDPMILLLDEPFSGLDLESVHILENFIRNVRGAKTVIVSTHDFHQAKRLCDKLVILGRGRILQVYDDPNIAVTSIEEVFERGA